MTTVKKGTVSMKDQTPEAILGMRMWRYGESRCDGLLGKPANE